MKKSDAAGIAAPQIGVSLRVFAIQFPAKKEYHSPVLYDQREMEPIPLQVRIFKYKINCKIYLFSFNVFESQLILIKKIW